ncbi:MAG: hypothetical protein V4722_16440 [Bacteroidota bacterium]
MRKLLLPLLVLCCAAAGAQNAGIGITIPLSKLHIASADSNLLMINNTSTAAPGENANIVFKNGASYTGAIRSRIDTTIFTSSYSSLSFYTYANNSLNNLKERMTINDNGDVGIGIIRPIYRLHLVNAASNLLMLENSNTLAAGTISRLDMKTGNYHTAALRTVGTFSSFADFQILTGANTDPSALAPRITVTNIGRVGIGTTNPSTTLDVNGGAYFANTATFNESIVGNFNIINNGPSILHGTIRYDNGSFGVGKTLTSDALGWASWQTPNKSTRAGLATTQPIGGSLTDLGFVDNSSGAFDDIGTFDNAGHRLNVTEAGTYQVILNIGWTGVNIDAAGDLFEILILGANNTQYLRNITRLFPGNANYSQQVSGIIKVAAGGFISVQAYHLATAAQITSNSAYTNLSITKLN